MTVLEPPPPVQAPGTAEPERMPAWLLLRADLATYLNPAWPLRKRIRFVLLKPEIWFHCLHRGGTWLKRECPRPLSIPLRILWRPWFNLVSAVFGIHISEVGRVGPGLHISHYGGIWVNGNARLGADCHIGTGVVIGAAGQSLDGQFAPVVGDRVWIGPHAVITGRVRVGNDCVIGANSLVAADVPDMGAVVGVPGHVINRNGSAHLIPRTPLT